ncbi:Maestro heat-like repeat-containing protein family member 7 [Frankliniella fusca]|uniref:Maestro heat-like repeat-containing protein family member 7 n=1 Tax=Frankliniella fusca TaxID=407009 RepID=A0AAE1LBC8_9NEOP|nr:Maestro heat-like repeat-containing protein family member 7 [Frankliniella fusca]
MLQYQPRRRKAGRARGGQQAQQAQQDRPTPGLAAIVKAEEMEAPSSSCQGYPQRSDVSARTTPDACTSSSPAPAPAQSPLLHPAFSPGGGLHPVAVAAHHHADPRAALPRSPYGDADAPLYASHFQAQPAAHAAHAHGNPHDGQYHAHLGLGGLGGLGSPHHHQPHQPHQLQDRVVKPSYPCARSPYHHHHHHHQYGTYGPHSSYSAPGPTPTPGPGSAPAPGGLYLGVQGDAGPTCGPSASHAHAGFVVHGAHVLGPDASSPAFPHVHNVVHNVVHGGHSGHGHAVGNPGYSQVSAHPHPHAPLGPGSAAAQGVQPYPYQPYCSPTSQKYS